MLLFKYHVVWNFDHVERETPQTYDAAQSTGEE